MSRKLPNEENLDYLYGELLKAQVKKDWVRADRLISAIRKRETEMAEDQEDLWYYP